MNPKKKVLKDLSFHNFFMYSIFHFYTKNNIYMHLVYIIIKNNLRDNRNRLIGLPTLERILKEHGYDLKRKKKGKRKIMHYMIKKL